MNARTHLAFGFLFGLLSLAYLKPSNYIIYFAIVLFAALLPDCDHPDSSINKKVPIFKVFAYIFKHRGFFHTLWVPLVVFFLLYKFGYYQYGVAVAVGYGAHLLSDGLTKMGVNIIHPLKQLRVQGFVETGGLLEHLIFGLVVIACVLLLVF
ncbi:metal-dependent hydrolase [Candidatus Woesearchaeota archaeon]|nr:metal-dependent hydrolase [Candidatus Woesearchaeota archaeon]